jgi:hypothetical protein
MCRRFQIRQTHQVPLIVGKWARDILEDGSLTIWASSVRIFFLLLEDFNFFYSVIYFASLFVPYQNKGCYIASCTY